LGEGNTFQQKFIVWLETGIDELFMNAGTLAILIIHGRILFRSLIPMLNGNHRKAPLFIPAEDVEPD